MANGYTYQLEQVCVAILQTTAIPVIWWMTHGHSIYCLSIQHLGEVSVHKYHPKT